MTGPGLGSITCDLLFFLEGPLCGFSLESGKEMFLSLETGIEKAPLPPHTSRLRGKWDGCEGDSHGFSDLNRPE